MTPEEKKKAQEPSGAFWQGLAQSKWTACEFQEIYFSLCDMHEGDQTPWLNATCQEVLDFAGCLAKFGIAPSLVTMSVPFGVRRQCYEMHQHFEALFYTALNSNDFHFNFWAESQSRRNRVPLSKALLAKALWKWYYTVFEPIAIRFTQIGSEHHSINGLK